MKTCSVCKISKPLNTDEFAPQSTGRDGYRANCRECDRKRAKKHVITEEQKEKKRIAVKRYYYNNREKVIAQASERYYKKRGPHRKNKKHDFKSEAERRAYLSKEHCKWLKKNPEKARELNKQSRQRHGDDINAKISLSRGLGIPYKDVKKFPELIELKKIQLAGLKEATKQINPNNKNYNKNGS